MRQEPSRSEQRCLYGQAKRVVFAWAPLLALASCSATNTAVSLGPSLSEDGGNAPPTGRADAVETPREDFVAFGTDDGGAGETKPCTKDPANYDIPGNQCDDDGDGLVDNVVSCDGNLNAGDNAEAFAKALGLCKPTTPTGNGWGLVKAVFTNGYASDSPGDFKFNAQHGILPKFGNLLKPQEGSRLGVLSSGYAAEYNGGSTILFKGEHGPMQGRTGTAPPGYPKPSEACSISSDVQDVINLRLTIRVPKNAKGFAFDFNFLSGEWPEYVCSDYNDSFVAVLQSQAFNGGKPENISFDAKGNPVSVNNGFFDRCTPNIPTACAGNSLGPLSKCSGGESELAGTGFYQKATICGGKPSTSGGATGWLSTQAPVSPGETMTLSFIIWDTGDSFYDSSVLLDHFRWVPAEVKVSETTRPVPR